MVYSIFSQVRTYDWFCHLPTFFVQNYYKGGQVTKPIICICEAINYCMSFKNYFKEKCHLRRKYFRQSNFLASVDIKVFGHTCLFAMLLLIGLTFSAPRVILFSICDRLCENRPCSHLVIIRETLV